MIWFFLWNEIKNNSSVFRQFNFIFLKIRHWRYCIITIWPWMAPRHQVLGFFSFTNHKIFWNLNYPVLFIKFVISKFWKCSQKFMTVAPWVPEIKTYALMFNFEKAHNHWTIFYYIVLFCQVKIWILYKLINWAIMYILWENK